MTYKFDIQRFATTTLSDLVNPIVVADTLTAELPKAIKFSVIADVDKTLSGQAGNTISVPQYSYIGDASVVNEGASISTTTLTATTRKATIYKVGKAVEITDEAMLSGTGKPIDEATNQLKSAIANKIDEDILSTLTTDPSTDTTIASVGSNSTALTASLISDAIDEFDEENLGEEKYLFVNPAAMGILRKDNTFTHASELGDKTLESGVVAIVYGCKVIPTRRLAKTLSVIAKKGAVSLYIKREANVETARNILTKTTTISADEHYVTAIKNINKIVKIVHKSIGS